MASATRKPQRKPASAARMSSIFYTVQKSVSNATSSATSNSGRNISSARSTKVKGPDCVAMNKKIAMSGKNGLGATGLGGGRRMWRV